MPSTLHNLEDHEQWLQPSSLVMSSIGVACTRHTNVKFNLSDLYRVCDAIRIGVGHTDKMPTNIVYSLLVPFMKAHKIDSQVTWLQDRFVCASQPHS